MPKKIAYLIIDSYLDRQHNKYWTDHVCVVPDDPVTHSKKAYEIMNDHIKEVKNKPNYDCTILKPIEVKE
jgi:hypothetical protein